MIERITFDADKCGGKACIRNMRMRVTDVLELLAHGASHEEILEDYPYLEADDITACLLYAAEQSSHAPVSVAAE